MPENASTAIVMLGLPDKSLWIHIRKSEQSSHSNNFTSDVRLANEAEPSAVIELDVMLLQYMSAFH